jgi:uncharacterized membrane protein YvbJ
MKKCPFCGQESPDGAAKCQHCGKLLKQDSREKWYFKPASLIIGFIVVGPLVLPLVWGNPRYSRKKKITISIIMIALTVGLLYLSVISIKWINDYYGSMLKQL